MLRAVLSFALIASASSCEVCPANTYYNGQGCSPCGPGTFRLDKGTCQPCPAGQFSPHGGKCQACPAVLTPDWIPNVEGHLIANPIVDLGDSRLTTLLAIVRAAFDRAKCKESFVLTHVETIKSTESALWIELELKTDTRIHLARLNNADQEWVLEELLPTPCDTAMQLSFSKTEEKMINDAHLTWKSRLPRFAKGKLIPVNNGGARRDLLPPVPPLDIDVPLPTDFDARDYFPGKCISLTNIRNQAGNSCPFYAGTTAASARLCIAGSRTAANNVLLSVQQAVDCAGAGDYSNGGYPSTLAAWQGSGARMCTDNFVPVTGVQGICTGNCSGGPSLFGNGTRALAPMLGGYQSRAWELELIQNGPIHVSITAYSDMQSVLSGIYMGPSPNAQSLGGHSVVLTGWGVDNGIPYWTFQNSWGTDAGEGGYYRILRGSNTVGILDYNGYAVDVATRCPGNKCNNASTVLDDCTCSCINTFRKGLTCSQCAATCQNGGVMNSRCDQCACVPGFIGPLCQYGVRLSQDASVQGDGSTITIQYAYNTTDGYVPPMPYSIVGFYLPPLGSAFSYSSRGTFCTTGARCADTGTFMATPPKAPGVYLVFVCWADPGGALYRLDSDVSQNVYMGTYTVLPANSTNLTQAQQTNGAVYYFKTLQAQKKAADAAANAISAQHMQERSDFLAQWQTVRQPNITILDLDSTNRVYNNGEITVCYYLPKHLNPPSKSFILYRGNSPLAGSNLISPGADDLGPANEGCIDMQIHTAASEINSLVISPINSNVVLVKSADFGYNSMLNQFSSRTITATYVKLIASWQIKTATVVPSKTDTVRLYDTNGKLCTWAYAQTGTQAPPASASLRSGFVYLNIEKATNVAGKYRAYFYPKNGTHFAAEFGYSAAQLTQGMWNWTSFWP